MKFLIPSILLCFFSFSYLQSQSTFQLTTAEGYRKASETAAEELAFNEAISAIEKAIALLEKDASLEDLAAAHNQHAALLFKAGQWKASKKAAERALGLYQKNKNLSATIPINAYHSIADYYTEESKFKQALAFHKKAVAFWEDKHAISIEDQIESRLKLAFGFFFGQEIPAFKAQIDASFTLLNDLNNTKSPMWAKYYRALGNWYRLDGKMDEAIGSYNKAIKIYKELGRPYQLRLAKTHSDLGELHYHMVQPRPAMENYEMAMNLYDGVVSQDAKSAPIQQILAMMYGGLGMVEKGIGYNNKALLTIKKTYGESHPKTAQAYHKVAGMYAHMREYEKALENLNMALKVYHRGLGDASYGIEYTYESLGINWAAIGEFNKGLIYQKKALEIHRQKVGYDNVRAANSMTYIGGTYQRLNQPEEALRWFNRSLEVKKRIFGPKNRSIAKTYFIIGIANYEIGDLDTAMGAYEAILQMYKEDFDKVLKGVPIAQDFDFYQILNDATENKANILLQQYKNKGELAALERANAVYEQNAVFRNKMREAITNGKDQLRFAPRIESIAPGLIEAKFLLHKQEAALQHLESAYSYAEKNKAAVLKSFISRSQNKIIDASLGTLKQDRMRLMQLKRKEESRDSIEIDVDKVIALEDDLLKINKSYDSVLLSIKERNPKYASTAEEGDGVSSVSITAVQNKLKDNSSLLEYVVSDSILYVFVITKSSFKAKRIVVNDLAAKITEFKQSILEKNTVTFKRTSFALYELLVAPLENDLVGDELVIVPDGLLWHLNFDLLITQNDEQNDPRLLAYLLKEYAISYANAAGLYLSGSKESRKEKNKLLAFSFSDSTALAEGDKLSMNRLRNTKADLPGSRKEISAIADLVAGDYYFGKEAVEANFKANAPNYGILHLALHGEIDNESPEDSKLYFTKNKDSIEDNFLHSYELFNLDLPAEMTVLSACNSGKGKITKGEGIMSLGSAFQYAGAKSVVMSGWEVSDEGTPELMRLFYYNLKQGLNKAKALQQAKLSYLEQANEQRTAPFYWGSFYLVGDTTSLQLENSSSNSWYWIVALIGIILVLVVGLLIRKNKRTA